MEVASKICSKCWEILPAHADYFNRDKNSKDGLRSSCKKCCVKWYKANKDKSAEYRKKNKDKIALQRAEYYKKNKDKKDEYYKKNKDKLVLRRAEYGKSKAKYKIHNHQLEKYEDTRDNDGLLEVRCAYCGKWFAPTNNQVKSRIKAINSVLRGENRFYCQDFCKKACPVYGQIKYFKQNQYTKSNEVNPQLRQRVFELDNYECQMCRSKDELHCHHVVPATQNPMTANDPDVCITLCKKCHANVHSKEGCRYHQLKCST